MSKILVIEDSPEVRERIVASLTFEGFDVVDAEDGVAGLQAAREIDPDLIICDILMPRLDGHATLSELRKDSSTAGIPFIFLSAKSQVSDLREGLQLGADDYLVKPFALKELIAAVNFACAGGRNYQGQETVASLMPPRGAILKANLVKHLRVAKRSACGWQYS